MHMLDLDTLYIARNTRNMNLKLYNTVESQIWNI